MRLALLLPLAILAGSLGGCEASPPDRARPPPSPAEDLHAFFPDAVGDRWRERVGEVRRTRGVTARTPAGLTVFFGQWDRRPAFHRVGPAGVALVSPSGEVLEPILRSPLRDGASWRYESGEGALAGRCEATVTQTGLSIRAADLTLEGCVRVSQVCRHPEGGMFPTATTRTTDATYCPGVGRVLSRTVLDPPLPGSSAPGEVALVTFRVAGGPTPPPPARFDCDSALLLPSDVQAACGPEWAFEGEESLAEGCTHRFSRGDARMDVSIYRRPEGTDTARWVDGFLLGYGGEPVEVEGVRGSRSMISLVLGASEGRHALLVQVSGGCEPAHAARLFPLLRSLVR